MKTNRPFKLHPVIYSPKPKYPTNVQFDRNDIFKMIPHKWKHERVAGVLLSSMLLSALLGGCSDSDQSVSKSVQTSTPLPTTTVEATPTMEVIPTIKVGPTARATKTTNIAPVFKGGDGFVSFGDLGEVVYYSFTEEEGFKFIKSILKNKNIQIDISDKKIPEIALPLKGSVENSGSIYDSSEPISKYPFQFDAMIHGKNKDVFVEFVSETDRDIAGEDPNDGYSNIDTLIGANLLQTELKIYGKKNHINAAVIYDPLGNSKEQSQEQLTEQIKQFISWMKAEGII